MLRQQKKAALLSLTALVLSTMAARPLAASHPPTRPVSIGVNANYEHNLVRSANLGWSRMDIIWAEIQPTPSAWNIGPTNDRVNFAIANGQQVLAILHVVPAWLSSNGNIPPYSTTEWSAFVRRMAQEFRGRIAAYEIWNEPDQKETNKDGIGWGRNIEEPPLFIDFVHAAAVEIRAQAPGTLVVAPAFMSRNDADGADNRKRRILQQAEQTFYSDGQGTSFIDVISVHNNAGSTETALTMGTRLNYENLAYVWNHAPSLRHRPVWVTEYGWRSNAVGESAQRQRTCEVNKTYAGYLSSQSTHLYDWDVRRAFIFTLRDPNNTISNTIFRADASPKPVVTQYLQILPYPAVQNANNSPSCLGTGFAASVAGTEDAGAALTDLGLGDPSSAVPAGFSELAVERSPDGMNTAVLFGDSAGGTLSIVVSPALGTGRSLLTDVGAEWTSGALQISISGMRDGLPIGKKAVRSVAAALDASFNRACLVETVHADENAVRRLGFSAPKAPAGYTRTAEQAEYTSPTRSCGAEGSAHTPVLDFTWTFEDAAGQVIRGGIYRYGKSFDGMQVSERSLHWRGKGGARYWVAADPSVAAPDPAALRAIAESMDPAFGK
ncbi:MAG: polysaccharide biosynthesis protein PslG [Acidobacteriota bacterium]|jgi:hypothetical protein|nr:polysaccharide biosynthesis protein PslG [Acidobacteriota bacterium]